MFCREKNIRYRAVLTRKESPLPGWRGALGSGLGGGLGAQWAPFKPDRGGSRDLSFVRWGGGSRLPPRSVLTGVHRTPAPHLTVREADTGLAARSDSGLPVTFDWKLLDGQTDRAYINVVKFID